MDSHHNPLDNLYVIATIFNPASYKSRTDLYYQFESHMKNSGVNLITIECVYGEDNNDFNVTQKNNPNHIQLKTNHPLWHKENLINIAIRKLPKSWRYVLWLDADIEFLEANWVSKVIEAFQKYDIIQVFKYAHFLGPNEETLETHFSFTYSIVEELPISKKHYNLFYPHPGYGWGMTRGAYEHLNGLLDWSILGSGDSHMAFSMIGRYSESMGFPKTSYTENYWKSVEKWQEKVKFFSDNKRIGYADCIIQHHFHGYREDRQYINRMKILVENKFDPINDLMTTENGLYQLKESRKDIIDQIFSYFNSRKEDKKQEDLVKATPPVRTPEEILDAALHVKRLIEIEKFKKIEKSIFKEKKKELKRSKSMNQNKTKKKNSRKSKPKQKKILIIEISSDINNFLSDSDSESSNYTDGSNSSMLSDFISVEGLDSPKRTRKGSVSDDLIMQCGICSSKKSVEEKNSNNHSKKEPSEGKNYNYQNNQIVNKPQNSKPKNNYQNNNNHNNNKNLIVPAHVEVINHNNVNIKKKKKKNKKSNAVPTHTPHHIHHNHHNHSHSISSVDDDNSIDNNFDENNYY